jgi:hypothetical protein
VKNSPTDTVVAAVIASNQQRADTSQPGLWGGSQAGNAPFEECRISLTPAENPSPEVGVFDLKTGEVPALGGKGGDRSCPGFPRLEGGGLRDDSSCGLPPNRHRQQCSYRSHLTGNKYSTKQQVRMLY